MFKSVKKKFDKKITFLNKQKYKYFYLFKLNDKNK